MVDAMTTSLDDADKHSFSPDEDARLHIVFVCTGNICRSPMAEIITADALEDAGLDSVARASSRGIGGWHIGQGADERAIAELRRSGHDGASHRVRQLSAQDTDADLFVALDSGHRRDLLTFGVAEDKIRLLRSFDPEADSPDVEDPYYGTAEDFVRTRHQIEAALPGILEWVKAHQAPEVE